MIKRKKTNKIIVHHSLSDYGNVDIFRNWHLARGWDDIGYHYVITDRGYIETGRDIEMQGAHAKGRNGDSIGVCFVGDFRKTAPHLCQLKAFIILYRQLCQQYKKKLILEPHRIKSNPCPGINFPFGYLTQLTKDLL